jgi:hypothetical protein
MLGLFVNEGANKMADKFKENKCIRLFAWGVLIILPSTAIVIAALKYLPALIVVLK